MTLIASLRTPELLNPYFRLELEQLVAGLQVQFNRNLPAPIHFVDGAIVPLTLSLRTPELLTPVERDELEHLVSAFQAAFNVSAPTSVVKSIQPVSITVGASTPVTATIRAVDVANAVLMWGGYVSILSTSPATELNDRIQVRLELTSATVVTAAANSVASGTTVALSVVEYHPGVLKSAVQRGTITIASNGGTTATAPIRAVNPAKSLVTLVGQTTSIGNVATAGDAKPDAIFTSVALSSDGTSVIATRGANFVGGTVTVGYEVLEFN